MQLILNNLYLLIFIIFQLIHIINQLSNFSLLNKIINQAFFLCILLIPKLNLIYFLL